MEQKSQVTLISIWKKNIEKQETGLKKAKTKETTN